MNDKPEGDKPINTAFPNGHFYSPVVDPDSLEPRSETIWSSEPAVLGIDFNEESHLEILSRDFPAYIPAWDFPDSSDDPDSPDRYFVSNSQFSHLDPRALFVLLQKWQPKRLVEVGSGFSSLLIAETSQRFLKTPLDMTCIEPYPRDFLVHGYPGIDHLIQQKVQDVPLSTFTNLEAGDVLFIDSSHVAKTGSDVNFLMFEVLPRLADGVHVHLHDIFLPLEYPRRWVQRDNRSWNEQYMLQALLMDSHGFRVDFGCSYAFWKFPQQVIAALALEDGAGYGGGSFWITRTVK